MKKKKREPYYLVCLDDKLGRRRVIWRGDNPWPAYEKFCKMHGRSRIGISWNYAQLKGITLIAKISLQILS